MCRAARFLLPAGEQCRGFSRVHRYGGVCCTHAHLIVINFLPRIIRVVLGTRACRICIGRASEVVSHTKFIKSVRKWHKDRY